MGHPTLDAWHRMIAERDATALDDVLADDAVFRDEPMRFMVSEASLADVAAMNQRIDDVQCRVPYVQTRVSQAPFLGWSVAVPFTRDTFTA